MPFWTSTVSVLVAVLGASCQPAAVQYFNTLDAERGTYRFGYDTGALDHQSFREETRTEDGVVRGRYGYVDSGVLRMTEYTADRLGYRCRQTIRHLVDPNKGGFEMVHEPDFMTTTSKAQQISQFREDGVSTSGSAPEQEMKLGQRLSGGKEQNVWDNNYPKAARNSWWDSASKMQWQGAQPARVLGKKVAGHYKDFTSEPAVGGTAAVTSWDSAHRAELRDDELRRIGHQSSISQPTIGGTLIWPTTEDGTRVVWREF